MRQVLINGSWESPPANVDIHEWLTERIAIEIDELLCITRYVHRYELIRAIRKSSKSKSIPVSIVKN